MLKILLTVLALSPIAAQASLGPELTLASSALSHPKVTQDTEKTAAECPLPAVASVEVMAVVRLACR